MLVAGLRKLTALGRSPLGRSVAWRIIPAPKGGRSAATALYARRAASLRPFASRSAMSADAAQRELAELRERVKELEAAVSAKDATQHAPEPTLVAPYSRSFDRTLVKSILQSANGGESLVGTTLRVGGWVKTGREAGGGAFAFLDLSDGTCFDGLQVMVTAEVAEAFITSPEGVEAVAAAGILSSSGVKKSSALGYLTPTSTSILVEGTLSATPPGTIQKVELKATRVIFLGITNAADYPLAKKRLSFEHLRSKAHLRPRTNTIGAVARIRNALAAATHQFFQSQGFLYVHTPIITGADCEGAGEMFQVTTLLPAIDQPGHSVLGAPDSASADAEARAPAAADGPAATVFSPDAAAVEARRAEVDALAERVRAVKVAAKEDPAAKAEVGAAVAALLAAKEALLEAEIGPEAAAAARAEAEAKEAAKKSKKKAGKAKGAEAEAASSPAAAAVAAAPAHVPEAQRIPRLPDGSVDYSKDFFGRPTFLTVSGQLNGEFYASALSSIYTFGPTFRAENSHTARHLAEFWMIEPEIAFASLEDNMRCAEDYVRYCAKFLLDNCRSDLAFINKVIDPSAIERLEQVASTSFDRISYTEAVERLESAVASGAKSFEFPVSWGVDLASEHERYLTEEIFKKPLIVYDYPRDIKAFYMRQNEDGKTVAAMDVLVPRVGELIGGSQREERVDKLLERIDATGMPRSAYEGYLDLRRFGTVPHSGFGLGFERLVLFATGIENIREVIPFPRWPGHAEY